MTDPSGFTAWLEEHTGEKDLLGSLARCVADDPHWPATGDLDTYRAYLQSMGASPELETALNQAWQIYWQGHM